MLRLQWKRICSDCAVHLARVTRLFRAEPRRADGRPRSSRLPSPVAEYGSSDAFWKRGAIAAMTLLTGSGLLLAQDNERRPWEETAVAVETGLLWQVGNNTPLSYRLVPTQLSWRSRETFGREFLSGRLTVRHRLTLMGTWFQQGPESHYIAVASSPSVEWWNKRGNWAVYSGAGGGVGWLDSQGVPGGQGQDFTLNWFARAGIEHIRSHHVRWTVGVMFHHLSNGGQTNPNPGIDALGFTMGWAWSF